MQQQAQLQNGPSAEAQAQAMQVIIAQIYFW
jgi:hypothetical protein